MRSRVSAALALLAIAGCGGEQPPAANDPNRPAVVQAPPLILPSDTAKPDTMPATIERLDQAKRELANEYAILAAAAILGDAATVTSFYTPSATLRFGDSTYTGQPSIAMALVSLMRRSSVREMVRQSVKMTVSDSVFADSGIYGILSRRDGGAAIDERGTYTAEWVFGGTPKRWSMRRDRFTAPAPAPAPTRPRAR